jgi:hypothetical protein
VYSGGSSAKKRWLVAAALALVAAMAFQLVSRRTELAAVWQLSIPVLLIATGFQLLSQLMWNAATLLPLRRYAKDLGFWELYIVRMGGFVIGGLVPVAGNFALRMAYLKRHRVSYAQFTWATIIVNVVGLLAAALLALGALATLSTTGHVGAAAVGLVAAVSVVGVAAIAAMYSLPRLGRHPWAARWPILRELGTFAAGDHSIGGILAISFLRHLFLFLSFGLLYQRLSSAADGFVAGGLAYAISSPIRIVSIVPGNNLGLNEWAVAVAGKALSFDVTTGLLVAIVSRGLAVAGQVIGVGLSGVAMAFGGRSAAWLHHGH